MNGTFSRKPANRCLEIIETSPERLGLCLEISLMPGLSSEAAYALLLAFVEGYADSFAYNAREKELSFCKLWESIQKANTSYTLVDVEEEV